MRTQPVGVWLDAGTPKSLLETNRYLLEHGHDNSASAQREGVTVIPPVFISPNRPDHQAQWSDPMCRSMINAVLKAQLCAIRSWEMAFTLRI